MGLLSGLLSLVVPRALEALFLKTLGAPKSLERHCGEAAWFPNGGVSGKQTH